MEREKRGLGSTPDENPFHCHTGESHGAFKSLGGSFRAKVIELLSRCKVVAFIAVKGATMARYIQRSIAVVHIVGVNSVCHLNGGRWKLE